VPREGPRKRVVREPAGKEWKLGLQDEIIKYRGAVSGRGRQNTRGRSLRSHRKKSGHVTRSSKGPASKKKIKLSIPGHYGKLSAPGNRSRAGGFPDCLHVFRREGLNRRNGREKRGGRVAGTCEKRDDVVVEGRALLMILAQIVETGQGEGSVSYMVTFIGSEVSVG